MAKRKRTRKPNCNHPPDKREVLGSESRHIKAGDRVERVIRCTVCSCWCTKTSKPKDEGDLHQSRWFPASHRFPYWLKVKK